MLKNNFYYFKRPLILIVPIAVFVIIKELLGFDFSSFSELLILLEKGILVGVLTSVILGFLNAFTKIEAIFKKE